MVGLADNVDPLNLERLRAQGYVEVFPKPVNVEEVVGGLRRILERRRLQQLTGLIGESDAMREVMVQVEQMAPVSSTVLIEGESGTGKELVARAIRMLSNRRNKPFIAVNVGALPESLLESELFGHEKGAFTGAAERRLGRFELADTGTLFLDEIGEIPLGHAGEAAAGARGAGVHARGRGAADHRGRAGGRGDQPAAARARGGRAVPRRPVLPAERAAHLSAAAARAA